jgi:UDP-N-acetylglucosamine 2-epimerase (hydrolysing)
VLLNKNEKILFLTGTRADFGKIKSLISILEQQPEFGFVALAVCIWEEYGCFGSTEIQRFKECSYFQIIPETTMDLTFIIWKRTFCI